MHIENCKKVKDSVWCLYFAAPLSQNGLINTEIASAESTSE